MKTTDTNDHGQRYHVTYEDQDGNRQDYGWTDSETTVDEMMKSIHLDKNKYSPMIHDREAVICDGCGCRHTPNTECPDGTKWLRGPCWCRMCGHKWEGVWPNSVVDERMFECPNCKNITGQPDTRKKRKRKRKHGEDHE